MISLEPGNFYHIYNRGNNGDDIFIGDRNYHYFINLWNKYFNEISDLYCYCLLKNHFHLLIKIKDLSGFTCTRKGGNLTGLYVNAKRRLYLTIK